MNRAEWKEFRRQADDPNQPPPEVKTADVLDLLDTLKAATWLASVVWLHYKDREDLDPIQEKHLELAKRVRALVDAPNLSKNGEGK